MAIATAYHPSVPLNSNDEKIHRRQIATSVNNINQGHMNCTLAVTLNANSTTTTIQDARIGLTSAIVPAMATTANGATAIKNGIYVTNIISSVGSTPGSAILNHASNAATDQNITLTIVG